MSTINRNTLQAIINLFNSASDDATRYHLNFVSVRAKAGKVHARATDGHILAQVQLADEAAAKAIGEDEFVVSPDTLDLLKLLLKQFKPIPEFTCVREGSKLLIGPEGRVRFETAREANIQFPNVDQVVPKLTGLEFAVAINPNLLMDLFKALNQEKRSEMVTLILSDDPMKPITVMCSDQYGVLMPMRNDTVKDYQQRRDEANSPAEKKGA